MPDTLCKLALVNSCVYYAHQTREIYCPSQWISKILGSFEIHSARQYVVNVLFGIKDLQTSEITVKLKSNMYVRPANIFIEFWHYLKQNALSLSVCSLWCCKWSSVPSKFIHDNITIAFKSQIWPTIVMEFHIDDFSYTLLHSHRQW